MTIIQASDLHARRTALCGPVLFALASVATALACTESTTRQCRVGADCASGMCGADGTCVAGPGASSGSSGGASDAGDVGDATPPPPDDGGNLVVPGCTPNKDGTIVQEEVPIKPGLRANYRIAEDVDVSTAGTPIANGRRKWDFSAALPNESTVLVETLAVSDKWYGSEFKSATYATQLRKSSNLIGVFETAGGSLNLQGVVSPNNDLSKTDLSNNPPVSVLAFPLMMGKTWSTTTTVSGTAQGYPVGVYTEKYDSQVDAVGDLVTPLGTFDVQRVRVDLTRTVGFLVTTYRTYAFVTECYGTVANIASNENEPNVEFTHAAEIRRIAP